MSRYNKNSSESKRTLSSQGSAAKVGSLWGLAGTIVTFVLKHLADEIGE